MQQYLFENFLMRDTIAFWKMSLLHWLKKLTSHTLYREKIIGEVFWRQWRHGDWTLKVVSEIAFCFTPTTGFVRIVIMSCFMEKDFGTNFKVWTFFYKYFYYHEYCYCCYYYCFITTITITIFVTFLFSLELSLWLY